MKKIIYFFCLACPIVFGGCASISPDIGDMTQAYSETVEKHERNQILKNLLRAGDSIPMSFTTVPTIIGSGTLEAGTGVTGQLYGSLFSNASNTTTLRGSRSFNFTLSSLDNERFISAFLGDISLDSFELFSGSDFHQQLFYTLLIDRVTINPEKDDRRVIENGTSSKKRFNTFQTFLEDLTSSGLRTEKITYATPVGIDLSRQELLSNYFSSGLISDKNIKVTKTVTPAGDRYRVIRLSNATRFCLSTRQFEKLNGIKLSPNLDCKASNEKFIDVNNSNNDKNYDSLEFDVRSAREVYRYIGRLVASQISQNEWIPSIELKKRQAGILAGSHPLIVVKKGQPVPGERVLAVAEHMGSSYYVPIENSGFSSRVFEYLSLLLSTSMVKDAIPASPGILVR
ncbi:MAG: hypothetical protein RLY40_1375 [Pseudomonadota bacterium]|jgi:hypothetical protein